MSKLIPSTLALIAVQRQTATSKSTKPASTAQHWLEGGEPMTRLTTPPRRSTQAPSFNVSIGQKGFTGGAAGGGLVGMHAGGGLLGMHGIQAWENVDKKRREKMKMPTVEAAMAG
ncbi:hypothetical protein HYC85_017584 [Camellia sinensis]|uniref:Uncharacterized protein n=1 Tax=Camellia sinensis TaxID=4442 RepID=A0A7J7GSS8_CAMSI|nr:hypothetical protein HYC85_017584 [Camellia sinensis]